MSATVDLVGQMAPMRVRLDRGSDRAKPCHDNIAIVGPGKPPHAAELRCATCNAHRGWLRAEALTFVETLAQRFGASTEPIILRDTTIGDHQMTTERKFESKPNSGALFRNTRKHSDTDADYFGSVNLEGREFRISAWLNVSKQSGQKYMRLAIKPKDDAKTTAAPNAGGRDFDDSIPFGPEWR